MRRTIGKSLQIAGMLAVALILSGCGNQQALVSENITTEVTTEVVTEAPDTTSPVIELASDGVAYYIGDKYDPMDYISSVTDDTDETIKAEYDDKNVNIASPGDYVISYSATDAAGNRSEKKLKFKVKKEYTRDEIKEIAQDLIDNKYYNFEISDDQDYDESECVEGSYTGGIYIWGNFDDVVSDEPPYIWGTDPEVYTWVYPMVLVNDRNFGIKNANTDTLNSELLISVRGHSGEGKLSKAISIDISSDSGKMKVDNILKKGTYIFDEPGYFKNSQTFICFKSDDQINEFKEILEANNVNIKVHFEEGNDFVYTLRQNQRDNFLKVFRYYEDINEYVNNIP